MKKQIVYIGADHGGFSLKEKSKVWFAEWGYNFEDLGATSSVLDDDYPQYAFAVANRVSTNKNALGVLFCKSGAGMVIAANKVKGIRAVDIYDKKSAVHAKEHNNANTISVSASWLNEVQAREIIEAFLETTFLEEKRHARRIDQITEYEKNKKN